MHVNAPEHDPVVGRRRFHRQGDGIAGVQGVALDGHVPRQSALFHRLAQVSETPAAERKRGCGGGPPPAPEKRGPWRAPSVARMRRAPGLTLVRALPPSHPFLYSQPPARRPPPCPQPTISAKAKSLSLTASRTSSWRRS